MVLSTATRKIFSKVYSVAGRCSTPSIHADRSGLPGIRCGNTVRTHHQK